MPEGTTVNLKLLIQAVDKASKTVASLKGQLNEVSKSAVDLSNKSAIAGDKGAQSMKKMDGATKDTKSSLDKLAGSITSLGAKMTGLGAAISAPFALAIAASSHFEKAFARVLAVTDNAQESFEELKETAAELGRTTRFTATQVAEGMAYLGQAGFEAKEVISGIGPAITLAKVAAVDLATAADLATNVLSGMRLGVDELGNAIDVLANTAAESNTNLIEMAEAVSYAGPVAAAVGVDIEQLASLVGVLGNAGIKGSRAGTALRQSLFRLANPTEKAKEAMKELGIELNYQSDGSLDLIRTLNDLADANITAGEANEIFGRYATAGVLAITSQKDELAALVKSNYAAAGAAERMGKIMSNTFKGAVTKLTSALEGMREAIGDKLLPIMTKLTKALASTVTGIVNLLEKFPVFTGFIVQVVAVTGFLLTTFGAVTLAIGGFTKALAVFTKLPIISSILGLNTAIAATGTAAATSSVKVGYLATQLKALKLTWTTQIALGTKFSNTLAIIGSSIKALAVKLGALVMAHPFLAAAAAITAAALALLEWDKRLDKAISHAKVQAAELEGLNSSFAKQIESLDKLEKGSDAYAAATKNLEKQVLKAAEEHEELEVAALKVAEAIDDVTGEIKDGSDAIEKFVEKARELELEELVKQVELLTERWKRMNGEGGFLSETLEGSKKIVRGMAYSFADLFSVIAGGDGGHLEEALKADTEAAKRLEEQLGFAAATAIKGFQKYGEIDMSASTDEMEIFFSVIRNQGEESTKIFIEQFEKMQKAANEASREVKEIDEASTGELTVSVSQTIEKVKELAREYEEAAEKSKLLASTDDTEAARKALEERIEANKKRLKAEEEFNNKVEALRRSSTGDLKENYDDELNKLKRAKELEYIEEWDFNLKKAKLDEDYSRSKVNNLKSILELAKASGVVELEIYKQLNRELEKLVKERGRKEQANTDAQILHANQVKDAILDIQKSTRDIEIDLSGDFNAQQAAKQAAEIEDLRTNAARVGINDREVLAKAEAAIKKKYVREALEYEEKLRETKADAAVARTQELADRQVEKLEEAFEKGEISPEAYVNKATAAQTAAIDAEITELYNKIAFAQNVLNDNPLVQKLKIEVDQLNLEKKFVDEDSIKTLAEARAQTWIRELQNQQGAIESALQTLPDNFANMEERNQLEIDLLKNKHQQEIQEMTNNGATQVEVATRTGQQVAEVAATSAEQQREAFQANMQWGEELAGTMSDAFSMMYEVTGKKSKELFYLQKAAAIAETTISTAAAIMKAWQEGGPWAGSVMAAMIAMKGAAQLAVIGSQSLAEGGKVEGSSPSKKSDNIPAWLTANEFVHPVDTVKYYGEDIMEALRRRIIPKEVFAKYSMPVPRYYHQGGPVRLAAGGSVPSSPAGGTSSSTPMQGAPQQKFDIINIVDENMMEKYVSSNSGKRAVFNIIRSNSFELKNALSQEM